MPKKGNKKNKDSIELCKICTQPVHLKKNGLKCHGTCGAAVHYTCVNYTPGEIKDIQNGYISVLCPCPNCSKQPAEETLPVPTSPPPCEMLNDTNDQRPLVRSCGEGRCGEGGCCSRNKLPSPQRGLSIGYKRHVFMSHNSERHYTENPHPKTPSKVSIIHSNQEVDNKQMPAIQVQILPEQGQISPIQTYIPLPTSEMKSFQVQVPSEKGQMPPIQVHIVDFERQAQAQFGQTQPHYSQMPPIQAHILDFQGQMPPLQVQVPDIQGQMSPLQAEVPYAYRQMPPIQAAFPQYQVARTAAGIQTIDPSKPPHAAEVPQKRMQKPTKVTPEMIQNVCETVGDLAEQLKTYMHPQECRMAQNMEPKMIRRHCPGKDCEGELNCPARYNHIAIQTPKNFNVIAEPRRNLCAEAQCPHKINRQPCPGLKLRKPAGMQPPPIPPRTVVAVCNSPVNIDYQEKSQEMQFPEPPESEKCYEVVQCRPCLEFKGSALDIQYTIGSCQTD